MKTIGNSAFFGCSRFNASLNLPNDIDIIIMLFSRCSGLKGEFQISIKVKSIGNYTFNNCSKLQGSNSIPNLASHILSMILFFTIKNDLIQKFLFYFKK